MKENYYYTCPCCDHINKIERADVIVKPDISQDENNKIIEAIQHFYYSQNGVPLPIMPNVLMAIMGYQYPEEYKPTPEELEELREMKELREKNGEDDSESIDWLWKKNQMEEEKREEES